MALMNPLLGSNLVTGPAPFDPTLIGNSVWLDGSADDLDRSTTSHSLTECVMACWFQLNTFSGNVGLLGLGTGTSGSTNSGLWLSGGTVYFYANGNGVTTNQLLRDIGWYHILASFKLDESTASNKGKLFINGEEVTSFAADPRSSWGTSFASTATQSVGSIFTNTFLKGYIAQAVMLDGQSIQGGDVAITDFLDTFTFGTNGSQYVPKADADIAALATTAGGNSFCLDFSDSADLGNDISSNANDFTPNSMAAANQSTDTPSLNYAVLNILDKGSSATTSEGATRQPTATDHVIFSSMLIPTTGKWAISGRVDAGDFSFGICTPAHTRTSKVGRTNDSWGAIDAPGASFFRSEHDSVGTNSTVISSINDTFIIAFDADSGKLWLGRNHNGAGIAYLGGGDPTTGATPTYTLSASEMSPGLHFAVGRQLTVSFGQRTHFETLPTDFLELNSANLTAPDYQGIDYFDATLYEGNGTGQRVGDFVPFTDAFNVANSAMFQHDEVRALSRTIGTPSSTGGKKGTWSVWYKTGVIDTDNIFFDNGTTATNRFSLNMDASGQIIFSHKAVTILKTSADFKGDGAWHNVVLKVDTSLATAADRAVMFFDGVEITSFETDQRDDTNLSQNDEIGYMDSGATQFVGSYNGVTANQWDGYFAETIFLDNQFLSADSFGQLDTSTNKWVPKDVSGLTLGDQGFYLAYGGNFGTGNGAGDSTGNSNNLTEIGTWATSDQFIDTPSNNVFTFATDGTGTISEGNTRVDLNNSVYGLRPAIANFPSTGKFYGEFLVNAVSGSTVGIGYARDIDSQDTTNPSTTPNNDNRNFLLQLSDGNKINGDSTGVSYGSGITAGQTAMWAFDAATGKIWFGSEGTFFASGDPAAGTNEAFILPNTGTVTLVAYDGSNARTANLTMRNATAAFEHTAPTGFTPFTQDNLDDTASKLTAWAWIKNRDAIDSHILVDRVRGVGEVIHSNEAAAEATEPNTVQRFLQRGVQVGSDVQVNTANESYVLWQWLMGDSATTGTVNNDGSIASTLIAADAGHLSIGTYIGTGANATVGHGLGGAPEMIIVKDLDVAIAWPVYHEYAASDAENYNLVLDTTAALFNDLTKWNGTAPTSTVFSIGTNSTVNTNTERYFFITFRSVAGVCKVGSYVGTGSASAGPYIDLGFEPAFFMAKSTGVENWIMLDNQRPDYNPTGGYLFANLTNVEGGLGNEYTDFLSSGIKLRTTGASANSAGVKYIYLAMADIGGNGTLPPIYGK